MAKNLGLSAAASRELRFLTCAGPDKSSSKWNAWMRSKGFVNGRGKVNDKRVHAALAAPRMTQAEFDALEWIEGGSEAMPPRIALKFFDAGWIETTGQMSLTRLTPSGRTALNNVRAAMGAKEWKEVL